MLTRQSEDDKQWLADIFAGGDGKEQQYQATLSVIARGGKNHPDATPSTAEELREIAHKAMYE